MIDYILGPDADLDLDIEGLGQIPGMGQKREDLTRYPVLFWPVGSYLVIYRAEGGPIEIVAVTQGSRDIPAFLEHCTADH